MKNLIKILLISLTLSASLSYADTTQCVPISLDYNLRLGAHDAQTSGNVSKLQSFLQSLGYLTTSPSGYFGSLTLKAVQKFQGDNGVSATGYVGPTTRSTIKNMCSASAQNNTTTPSTPISSTPTTPTCKVLITTPFFNERFALDTDTFTINWNNISCDPSISLIPVIKGTSGGQTWNLPSITEVATGTTGTTTPDLTGLPLAQGLYYVTLKTADTNQTISNTEQVFIVPKTVVYQALTETSLSQTTAPNDGTASITVYGTGFASSSVVYLGGGQNIKIIPTSIDTSGTYLNFTVPSTAVYGPAGISISNDGKTFSNQLPFTITAPSISKYTVTTDNLANGNVGVLYDTTISAGGFINTYTWSITKGSLPPGITYTDGSSGYLAPMGLYGTPTTAGTYPFTVTVTDTAGNTASKNYSVVIGSDPNANSTIPAIYNLSSTSGVVGTGITITGRAFNSKNYVLLNDRVAGSAIASSDGKTLSFSIPTTTTPPCNLFGTGQVCSNSILPIQPGIYSVKVENNGGESTPVSFTVTPSTN